MKLKKKIFFDETALHLTVERERIDIVELLLSQPNIDVNIKSIFNNNFNIVLYFHLFIAYQIYNFIQFLLIILIAFHI